MVCVREHQRNPCGQPGGLEPPTDAPPARTHLALRRVLARHLIGSGIEVGPGHQPFELPYPGTAVRFVDRWQPQENRRLFPELGADAPFVAPDIVANFDTDRLRPIADESQDFVVCSHVLEHLAEPIGFLEEIHRVLRPGGTTVLLLPNRHRTFDRRREPTPLAHLLADHAARVTEVDDDHMIEFLRNTIGLPEDPDERDACMALQRDRTIHVHCWDEDEFLPVLLHTVDPLGLRWEFVDGLLTDDLGEAGFEFGYVLRKSTVPLPAVVLRDRLAESWQAWRQERRATTVALAGATSRIAALQAEVATLHARLADSARPRHPGPRRLMRALVRRGHAVARHGRSALRARRRPSRGAADGR